ncbi:MAG: hypothetical protein KAT05_16995 [Spirochaetes bacterium]|nr:hypothetical protein [Spirochaetota bacterium]
MKNNEEKYKNNLIKTFELIDLVFKLKQAHYKQKYPEYSIDDIEKKIYNDILKRKNIQWKYQRDY